MRHNFFAVLALVLLAAGCATAPSPAPPQGIPRPAGLYPADSLVTHRAILTVAGRQTVLNGYVSISAARDLRLVVTETFGRVMADVLVKHDGAVYVMRSSRMFKPTWIRDYLAADAASIFGETADAVTPAAMLDPNHFVVVRRWYSLDVRIIATRTGPQTVELFDGTGAESP